MPPSPSTRRRAVGESGDYDFVWTLSAVFIVYAAWVRAPTVHEDEREVTGMRAIALALVAQALAIAIQLVALFKDIGKSERVVTVIVLVVASVQIVLTRPRARKGEDAPPTATDPPTALRHGDNEDNDSATQVGVTRYTPGLRDDQAAAGDQRQVERGHQAGLGGDDGRDGVDQPHGGGLEPGGVVVAVVPISWRSRV